VRFLQADELVVIFWRSF